MPESTNFCSLFHAVLVLVLVLWLLLLLLFGYMIATT
jgi:hypothetical protein